jgi:hypothetical protein
MLTKGISRSITPNKLPAAISTPKLLKKIAPALVPLAIAGTEIAQRFAPGGQRVVVRPDVMIWWIPVYAVDKVEVAKSDKILKFRSIGGQFFAFQEADNMGIRIDFKLTGPLRFIYLHLFNMLYLYGIGMFKAESIEDLTPRSERTGASQVIGRIVSAARGDGTFVGIAQQSSFTFTNPSGLPENANQAVYNGSVYRADNIENFQTPTTEVPLESERLASTTPFKEVPTWKRRERFLQRKTFPVIMEEEIFIDMYLETLIWSKGVNENGIDEITVNLLLRRFIDPPKKFFIESREVVPGVEKFEYQRTENEIKDGKLVTNAGESIKLLNRRKVVISRKGNIIGPIDEGVDDDATFLAAQRMEPKRVTASKQNWKTYWRVAGWTDATDEGAKILEGFRELEAKQKAEIEKSSFKTVADIHRIETVSHKFIGTKVEDQASSEWKILHLNLMWRMFWTGYYTSFPERFGWKLSADPMISRIALFTRKTQWVKGQKDNSSGSTQTKRVVEFVKPETISEERDIHPYILQEFGISGETEIEDVFIVDQTNKQPTFEKMMYNGFTMHKLQGRATTRGDLQFSSPFPVAFEFNIQSNGYTNAYRTQFKIDNNAVDVKDGCTYYLGRADSNLQRTWTDMGNGMFRINCHIEDEMYLYVQQVEIINNEAEITAFIIHPTNGLAQ